MQVYVAGKNKERVSKMMRSLEGLGHTITYDWTDGFERFDFEKQPLQSSAVAEDELDAVRKCDLLILLYEENLVGALIETGAALSNYSHVWVVDSKIRSIFFTIPEVKIFKSDEELLEILDNTTFISDKEMIGV